MLTKNKIKFIRSLASKKERYSQRLFIIEGEKLIGEALKSGIVIEEIIGLEDFKSNYNSDLFSMASKKEMERISLMKKAPGILALAKFMDWGELKLDRGKFIALDRINDPGNLGTIIRIADWFGIDGIICSNESVDVYNEKVVQSSMGSIVRIPLYYEDLSAILKKCSLPKLAAAMEGDDFASFSFPASGILLMGSESHGISEELLPLIDHQITINRIGSAESLNVGVAAGILCQAFTKE